MVIAQAVMVGQWVLTAANDQNTTSTNNQSVKSDENWIKSSLHVGIDVSADVSVDVSVDLVYLACVRKVR